MRVIKFRGKRADTGEWIYGYLLTSNGTECEISDWNDVVYSRYDVDPDTVGQFTGLFDKNSKEIYEDDVVTWTDSGDNQRKDIVKWILGGLCLCNASYTVGSYGYLEVIGNVVDNPELLKGNKE